MSLFTRVLMANSGQPEIAKVNRKTGVLFLNAKIWDELPTDQKDFVLYHEDGHLIYQTADEYKANEYAISKFVPAGQFNNRELGKRIVVMKEILSKADNDYSNFTDPVSAIAGAVGGIFQTLPVLGVGSKSRIKEATAQAEAAAIKSKSTTKILLIVGTLLIVATVVFLTLRKSK